LWEASKDENCGVSCERSMGGRDREFFLADPKEWRVEMELFGCLLLGLGGAGDLAIVSFHIPVSVEDGAGGEDTRVAD
jgi:hypothetical protein